MATTTASATTVSCQRAIAKAGAQFVQARVKALSKCKEGIVKGSITVPCPDDKATASIATAADKLTAAIDKSCGGDDHVCGGILTNEDTPLLLGWPALCPGFERNQDPACTAPIKDCGDIAACIECVGKAAVDQAIALYYDALVPDTTANKALNGCQTAIGKATSAFLSSKTKALQKSWDAKLNRKLTDLANCVPLDAGDEKYIGAIAKAETKKINTICKACGGADKGCDQTIFNVPGTDGIDDLQPTAIGFPLACPAVTIPGGPPCGGLITDLKSLITCVDRVTAFKADCVDRLQVPQFASYQSECNVCVAPAPTGSCPTSLEFTIDGPNADLDTGATGFDHNQQMPSNGRLTLSVSCAGPNQPTCGQCNLAGPIDNAGGASFASQRCSGASWVTCATNVDCTNASVAGPCVYFLGAPQPVAIGGVSVCLLNQIPGAVSGTMNPGDGSLATTIPLIRQVYLGGSTEEKPCPRCVAGVCDDGDHSGGACTVNGSGPFGDVSLDCPPNSGANVANLAFTYAASTGTETRTVSTANPSCRQVGYTARRCLCDTCNNANQEACSSDADCPMSGGNPGVCGGRRCIGGSNAGAPCSSFSECPGGGQCNRPGEPTQPNSCLDGTAIPGDGTICQDVGGGEGECPEGPFEKVCSSEDFRSCASDAACNPPTCPNCLPGQTCNIRARPCFTGGGMLGDTVAVTGSADAPCDGVSSPAIGGMFCVPPAAASNVNGAIGLPGLGCMRLPGTAVLQ